MYFRKKETFLSPLTWYLKHSGSRHEPPRPHTYPPKHTIPLHARAPIKEQFNVPQILLSTLCQTALEVGFHGWVWVPNCGASPIIASVSPQPIPCLPVSMSLCRMCIFSSLPVFHLWCERCVVAMIICIVCVMFFVMFYTYNHVFVYFLLFPKLNRHLCYGVYWYNHTPTRILILWLPLYFHFVICTSTIVQSLWHLSPPNK